MTLNVSGSLSASEPVRVTARGCIFIRARGLRVRNGSVVVAGCAGDVQLDPVDGAGGAAGAVADEDRPGAQGALAGEGIQAGVRARAGGPVVIGRGDRVVAAVVDRAGGGVVDEHVVVIVSVRRVCDDRGRRCVAGGFEGHLELAAGGVGEVQTHVDVADQDVVADVEGLCDAGPGGAAVVRDAGRAGVFVGLVDRPVERAR